MPGPNDCIHHFIYKSPQAGQAQVMGICKKCGERKTGLAWMPSQPWRQYQGLAHHPRVDERGRFAKGG